MRRSGTVAVVVVLAVAFGVAAGGLPSSSTPATPAEDDAPPPAASPGAGSSSGLTEPTNPVSRAAYERLLAGLAAVGLAVAYVLAPRYRRVAVAGVGVLVVAAASYAWFRPDVGVLLDAASAAARTTGDVPVEADAVAIALAVATVGWYWRRRTRSDDEPGGVGAGNADDREAEDANESSAAAGPHPADVAASNGVYRAWQRAVADVSVSAPAARTPAEFARAARTEVADGQAVRRLTVLFRRVRYGDADPDAHDEEAASLAARATEGEDA